MHRAVDERWPGRYTRCTASWCRRSVVDQHFLQRIDDVYRTVFCIPGWTSRPSPRTSRLCMEFYRGEFSYYVLVGIAMYATDIIFTTDMAQAWESFFMDHLSWRWIFWNGTALTPLMIAL